MCCIQVEDVSKHKHYLSFVSLEDFVNALRSLLLFTYFMKSFTGHTLHFQGTSLFEMASMFLGTGSLFVWFGMLRYFGFFEKYNVSVI